MSLSFIQPLALLLFPVLAALVYLIARASRTYLAPSRRRLSLIVRLMLTGLLCLGLAQPLLSISQNSINVVFLVDASDSVGPVVVAQETDWIRKSLANMGSKDRAGIVVFGENALVESALSNTKQLSDLASAPVRSHTDLAGAIRLGMALLSGSGGRRLVVLSDGNENLGSALDEARVAALSGVEISVVPVVQAATPTVFISGVSSPATLRTGEEFAVTINVQASEAGAGTLYVYSDGVLSSQQPVRVQQGINSFRVPHAALDQGFHTFTARLESAVDPSATNKQGAAFTFVQGEPSVLIVDGQPAAGANLKTALASVNIKATEVDAAGIPTDLAGLRAYDTIILVNVPAAQLPSAELQTLQMFVRDLGGGLVTIGGDKSYAAGQYLGTALEDVLPVSSLVAPRKNLPSTAVIFIIESLENSLGVDISKEAAKSAIGFLSSTDYVAVNDTGGGWVVPLEPATNKTAINASIDAMNPSDPASYAQALTDSDTALKANPAKVKHIVLIGDGDAADSQYQSVLQQITADGITVSVVGTNVQPSDLHVLQDISQWGNGRYYDGNDPFDIPQLLAKETQLVARPAIVEGTFKPTVTTSSEVLKGFDSASFPTLSGYVATTAKPTAQVILSSTENDPLLAEWQYGLGHVLSWTSDSGGAWATSWASWPQYPTFWAQVVRESLPSNIDSSLQTAITTTDQGAHIVVDSIAPNQTYRNLAATQATVVDPNGSQSTVALQQTGPGRYEGTFPTPLNGAYLVQVAQRDNTGALNATQPTGDSLDYSPEYRDTGTNSTLLNQIAEVTHGSVLPTPEQAFAHNIAGGSDTFSLWQWLFGLGLFVFLFDAGVRRLRFGAREIAGFYALWRARVPVAPIQVTLSELRQRAASAHDQSTSSGPPRPGTTPRVRLTTRSSADTHAALQSIATKVQQQREQAAQDSAAAAMPAISTARAPHSGRARPASAEEAATVRVEQPATAHEGSRARQSPPQSGEGRARLLEAKRRARGRTEQKP